MAESISPPTAQSNLRLTAQRWSWLITASCAVLVFAISLWQNFEHIPASNFHPDESRWINRAYYLEELKHPTSAVWADQYLSRGQPPMGSYVMGLGLLLQGEDLTTNGPWDFRFGSETVLTWNITRNLMPIQSDLEAGRRTNVVLGAASALILFLLATLILNRVAGLVAGLFLAFHPLQTYLSSLATADALFTFEMAASALAAWWLAAKPTWWRALLLALALAAGAATKLSPLFIPIPLALVGILFILDTWIRGLPWIGDIWGWLNRSPAGSGRRLGWMLLVQLVLVAALFILSYPYLWPDPIRITRKKHEIDIAFFTFSYYGYELHGRISDMFEFRQAEMDNQAEIWPGAAIHTRLDALHRTWTMLTEHYSTTGRLRDYLTVHFGSRWDGPGIEVPLAIAGIAVLVFLAWQRGWNSPTALATGVLLAQSALIIAALGVDFDRYYLPLAFCVCLGVGMLAGGVWEVGIRMFDRRQAVDMTPLDPLLEPTTP